MSLRRSITVVVATWASVAVIGCDLSLSVAASGRGGESPGAVNGANVLAGMGEEVMRQLSSVKGEAEETSEPGSDRVSGDLSGSGQGDAVKPSAATATGTPCVETGDGREVVEQSGAVAEERKHHHGSGQTGQPGGSENPSFAQPTYNTPEAIVESQGLESGTSLGAGKENGGCGQPGGSATHRPPAGTVDSSLQGDVASEPTKAVTDVDGSKPQNATNNSMDSVLSGSSSEVLLDIEDALDESDLAGQWEREKEVMRRVGLARASRAKRNLLIASVFGGLLAIVPLAAAAYGGRRWWKGRQQSSGSINL